MRFLKIAKILGFSFTFMAQPLAALADTPSEIRVGVRSGPGHQIVELAGQIAKETHGLNIVPVVIDGLVSPNEALADGSLEANVFQHISFLKGEIANKGYDLHATDWLLYHSPLAVYSVKHTKLADLPKGGRIAIPRDTANRTRALLALEYLQLLKLDPQADEQKRPITPLDIVDNPLELSFIELDVTLLPRSLADVDAGAVSATHALRVANIPLEGAIGIEGPTTAQDYAVRLVVRPAEKDEPWVEQFGQALRSPKVKAFIEENFGTTLRPAF